MSLSATEKSAQPFILQGDEQPGTSSERMAVYYPGDHSTVVGECCQATLGHLQAIENAARTSFDAYRKSTQPERAAILNKLADLLEQFQDPLSTLITRESGKPIKLARTEVLRAAGVCRGYAAETQKPTSQIYEVDGHEGRVQLFPLGPVLAITPYNFPLNLVIHKLAPAIAAGCSITVKPAPKTPLTALYLGRLAIAAGYPAINVIPCDNELAEALVRSDAFAKLSFTGSAKVGWHLKSICGSKSVTLELGGNAAVIIDEFTKPVDEIAARVAFGAFTYSGQVCISIQRILIRKELRAEFQKALVEATRAVKVGDPLEEDVDMGPMISLDDVQRVRKLIKDSLTSGANVVYGGNTYNALTMNPTIMDRVKPSMDIWAEECFAPLVTLVEYDTFDEAIELANRSKYGIQTGIYSSDPAAIHQAYRDLETGGVIVNDIPTYRADLLPYGGVKKSGIGREGVLCGIREYSYEKVLLTESPRL